MSGPIQLQGAIGTISIGGHGVRIAVDGTLLRVSLDPTDVGTVETKDGCTWLIDVAARTLSCTGVCPHGTEGKTGDCIATSIGPSTYGCSCQ